MDEKDKEILDVLKQNSRESIKEIAKRTKLRPSTVHQRMKKLVDEGVIEKFTIKLNNKAVSENFIVLMLVKGNTGSYIDKSMIHDAHVKEIFGITGEYDVMIKMKFEDVDDFNRFILKFRGKKDIMSTLTMVVTANIKEEM